MLDTAASDAAVYDGGVLSFGSDFIEFDQQNTCQQCVGVTDDYRGEKIVLNVVATAATATAPEPLGWVTMVAGAGVTGFALRHRRRAGAMAAASG